VGWSRFRAARRGPAHILDTSLPGTVGHESDGNVLRCISGYVWRL
jgi:hypothetical protein